MFEIEIKCLLLDKDALNKTKNALALIFPAMSLFSEESQINHYFGIDGSLKTLLSSLTSYLSAEQISELGQIVDSQPTDYSLRTRCINEKIVKLVIKIAGNGETSANGVLRREFEVTLNISIDELDKIIINCGFGYLSKWSRQRQEYNLDAQTKVCFDRNAGYGWIVEIEKMADSEAQARQARTEVEAIVKQASLQELDPQRLERMFAFYNQNWKDYYGTDKVFIIT